MNLARPVVVPKKLVWVVERVCTDIYELDVETEAEALYEVTRSWLENKSVAKKNLKEYRVFQKMDDHD